MDWEFFHRPLVYKIDELLLDAGEDVEHCVTQLNAGITHLYLQVGLEILALTVQLFAFLCDVVEEL